MYKWILHRLPLKLCYIANENTLRKLKPKEVCIDLCIHMSSIAYYDLFFQLTPDQKVVFDKCRRMKSPDEFDNNTNVRRLIKAELREHFIQKRIPNVFKEINKMDDYIATIFREYVPIPEAWVWTLLSQVSLIHNEYDSDVVSTILCLRQNRFVMFVLLLRSHHCLVRQP